MTKIHYRYSPSATKRWLNCPGSLDAPPSKTSEYSEAGTNAHTVGEIAVRTGELVTDDEDTRAAVSVYVDFVESIREKQPILELIEETRAHAQFEDFGGTADYLAIYMDGAAGCVLHFVDYKHGEGVAVEAEENYQLLSYAVIFASFFGLAIDTYRLTIVQPRCTDVEPVQTWETTPERVEEHARAIEQVRSQKHFKAGDHCRWCSLASTCDTLRQESLRLAQLSFEQAEVEDLLHFHGMADAIRAALSQIEDVLVEKARLGFELPGHKIVESIGNRKWSAPEDKIFRRLRKLGLSKKQVTKTSTLSPAAVEKLLPKDARKGAFAGLITREHIGLRVVPETARGNSVPISVEQVFKDNPE